MILEPIDCVDAQQQAVRLRRVGSASACRCELSCRKDIGVSEVLSPSTASMPNSKLLDSEKLGVHRLADASFRAGRILE